MTWGDKNCRVAPGVLVVAFRYAASGIKQSREPKYVFAYAGTPLVSAYASPAGVPRDASPPKRTPLIASPLLGMLV